jgi:hypothetical protein
MVVEVLIESVLGPGRAGVEDERGLKALSTTFARFLVVTV